MNAKRVVDRNPRDRGLTLLETMLAIALASVVLYLVSMAIDFYLKSLDSRKQQVEEAQLARVILKFIANDLRSVVYGQATDGSAGGGQLGGGESEGSGGMSSGGMSSGGAASGGSTGDIDSLSLFPTTPGLYGSRTEIQVDVSRLPRVDEYQRMLLADDERGALPDVVSDVKTIAYYMDNADRMNLAVGAAYSYDENFGAGLRRRVLDRATTVWAQESGNFEALDSRAELMASEVYALEFRYYDGYEWYEEWDSESFGALPLVVEIVIELGNRDPALYEASTFRDSDGVLYGDHVYRLLVQLPTGEVSSPYDETETESSAL